MTRKKQNQYSFWLGILIVMLGLGNMFILALTYAQTAALAPGKYPDFDDNGIVGFSDFLLFAQNFNKPVTFDTEIFDLDNNQHINLEDFFIFADYFGKKIINSCAVCPDLNNDGFVDYSDIFVMTGDRIDMNKDGVINNRDGKCFPLGRKIQCNPTPSCFDGIKNQDEIETDYGGACFKLDKQAPSVTIIINPSLTWGNILHIKYQIVDKKIESRSNERVAEALGSGLDIDKSYLAILNEKNARIKNFSLLELNSQQSEYDWDSVVIATNDLLIGNYLLDVKIADQAGNVFSKQYPFSITTPNKNCMLVAGNGNDKNMNIVLMGGNFSQTAEFASLARRTVDLFVATEPFKKNNGRINYYSLRAAEPLTCTGDPFLEKNLDVKGKATKDSFGISGANCPDRDNIINVATANCPTDEIIFLNRNAFRSYSFPPDGANWGDQIPSFAVIGVGVDPNQSFARETLTYLVLPGSTAGDKAYLITKLDCVEVAKIQSEGAKQKEAEVMFEGKKLRFLNIIYQKTTAADDLFAQGYAGYFAPPICGVTVDVTLKFFEKVTLDTLAPKTALHEFGHSFGNLDDEYLIFKEDAPENFISVNCVDPNKKNLKCHLAQNSKAEPVFGCGYQDLCSVGYRSIMTGSMTGYAYFGEVSEKHIDNLITELLRKKSGK